MHEFEYVMVLVSIIVGLGIGHVLVGVGGIVDQLAERRGTIKLGIAYGVWLAGLFVWLVLFWWWEFRFDEYVDEWHLGLYFFLVIYAVALFLLCTILVPRSWENVDDLDNFFLKRRFWFYPLLAVTNSIDILDSYLKHGTNLLTAEPMTSFVLWPVIFAGCVIGLRANNIRPHAVMGTLILFAQFAVAFNELVQLRA